MSQKVLVIDANPESARLAEAVVQRHFGGGDVLAAQRATDAWDRLKLGRPDVIFLSAGLPDTDLDAVCWQLLTDPASAGAPVVLLADGNANAAAERYSNVVEILKAPLAEDALREVLTSLLPQQGRSVQPVQYVPGRNPARIAFSGHTGFFSIRAAVLTACSDGLTGVLRFFLNPYPLECYVRRGQVLFTTTRDAQLYCSGSPVLLSDNSLGAITAAQRDQTATGRPLFLHLSAMGELPHEDVAQLVRDQGKRVFANLWGAGRVGFEFEALESLPDFAKNFPAVAETPDNWLLGTLRTVRLENLMPSQRPDPAGSPAYTRKGYDLIQTLKLNEIEARFATAVNGAEPLPSIAKRIDVPMSDALLLVFRLVALEVMDHWSPNVLSLPSNPEGGPPA